MDDYLLWGKLEEFDAGEVSLAAFESWLYAHVDELEGTLGAEPLLDLVSLDFRAADIRYEVTKCIRAAYERSRPDQLRVDRAIRVLREFLDGDRDLWLTTHALARLRFEGPDESWIPSTFVYIDSELDLIPPPSQRSNWNPEAWDSLMHQKAPILEDYLRVAHDVARDFLRQLESMRAIPN